MTTKTRRRSSSIETALDGRAVAGVIQALALAKEAGVDPSKALKLVDWQE
jgi:hypothetical protein